MRVIVQRKRDDVIVAILEAKTRQREHSVKQRDGIREKIDGEKAETEVGAEEILFTNLLKLNETQTRSTEMQ